MINRGNWQLVRKYLKYRAEVDQLSSKSIRLEETWLRHLLEWANDKPFEQAPKKRPTLPEYILSARLDGVSDKLSNSYTKKVIGSSKRFFEWLTKHSKGYRHIIGADWLDTLKPARMNPDVKEHKAVTIEEIRAMSKTPVFTMRDRRIQAAAVFWFLSGIRIGAFVTLPLAAVDISSRSVKQWPDLGVQTKLKKRAITYLLDIPDLLEVVQEWDILVRGSLPGNGYWFAPLSPETGDIALHCFEIGKQRDTRARKDLQEWLYRVNLPYHSPHKFRHGHAVYASRIAQNPSELKAVSQNLMHSSLSVTDGIYNILSDTDLAERITNLGKRVSQEDITQQEIISRLDLLAAEIAEIKQKSP
jgi:integrase